MNSKWQNLLKTFSSLFVRWGPWWLVTTTPCWSWSKVWSIQTLTRDKDEDCWGESVTGPETDKPLGKGPSGCLLVSLTLLITKWLFGPREMHHRTGLVNKKCPVLRLSRVEGPDRKLMQLLSLVALLACTRLHKVAQGCTMLHSVTQFYWLHIENNVPRAPALQVQKVQIYWSIE